MARTGHGPDAESLLASKHAPDSVRLTTYLAEVKSIEGDSPGAQLLAQQALAKQPDFKDAMIVIARDYYRAHKWDLAKYALQAILDGADDGSIPPRDKDNPEALLMRGLIERDMGQRKEAHHGLREGHIEAPDLFEAYVSLGEMKLEAGNATEAQAPLEKAVRYAPNVAVAHLDLGDCYRLLGRPGDAKSRARQGPDDGLDPRRRALQPRPSLSLLADGPGRVGPRRSAQSSDLGVQDVQVDARCQDDEGAWRRRRRAPQHGQAKAGRAPGQGAGGRRGVGCCCRASRRSGRVWRALRRARALGGTASEEVRRA